MPTIGKPGQISSQRGRRGTGQADTEDVRGARDQLTQDVQRHVASSTGQPVSHAEVCFAMGLFDHAKGPAFPMDNSPTEPWPWDPRTRSYGAKIFPDLARQLQLWRSLGSICFGASHRDRQSASITATHAHTVRTRQTNCNYVSITNSDAINSFPQSKYSTGQTKRKRQS